MLFRILCIYSCQYKHGVQQKNLSWERLIIYKGDNHINVMTVRALHKQKSYIKRKDDGHNSKRYINK